MKLTEAEVMVRHWANRDISAWMFGAFLAAPVAAVLQYLAQPEPAALAMIVTTPVVVMYLVLRLIATVGSRMTVRRENTLVPVFIQGCASVAAVAMLVGLVALISGVTFLLIGPTQASAVAFLAAGLSGVLFIVAVLCMAAHGPAVAGHRVLLRPALHRAEIQVIQLVIMTRYWAARGRPEVFRLR